MFCLNISKLHTKSVKNIMREILCADSSILEKWRGGKYWLMMIPGGSGGWEQRTECSHSPTTASLRVWLSTGLVFIWHSYWPASEYLTSLIISCHSPALRSCLTIMRGSFKKKQWRKFPFTFVWRKLFDFTIFKMYKKRKITPCAKVKQKEVWN